MGSDHYSAPSHSLPLSAFLRFALLGRRLKISPMEVLESFGLTLSAESIRAVNHTLEVTDRRSNGMVSPPRQTVGYDQSDIEAMSPIPARRLEVPSPPAPVRIDSDGMTTWTLPGSIVSTVDHTSTPASPPPPSSVNEPKPIRVVAETPKLRSEKLREAICELAQRKIDLAIM